MNLSPFANSKSFKNFKELFDLIISKISSDGGDYPRLIEIALFSIFPLSRYIYLQTVRQENFIYYMSRQV